MPTIRLTLRNRPLKDGSFRIYIAVCHKQDTCYIATRFCVDKESQFRNQMVIKRPDSGIVNSKLRYMASEYQDRLDKICNPDAYSCKQIKDIILSNQEVHYTYRQACTSFIEELEENGRHSYALLIERSGRYFIQFTGDLMLSDITGQTMANFNRYLLQKMHLSKTTSGMMLSQIKSVINRQIADGKVSYEVHPFANIHISRSPVRNIDLSLQSFNKIRTFSTNVRKYIVARDCFLLSFYLGGMNLIDMMSITFDSSGKIDYVRTKTRNKTAETRVISIPVIAQAEQIITKWIDRKTHRLDFGYKFSYHNFSRYVSRTLADIATITGIEEKLLFYSARKSFAQFSSDIGIPDNVIDYCLGHSDSSKGVIRYYTKIRFKQADIALSRVADYVENPDKYKELIEMRENIMLLK